MISLCVNISLHNVRFLLGHKMYISILRTNIANKAGRRWKTLSDNLEVEPATCDVFLATNLGVTNDATMAVLNHWAGGNTSKPSTWSALLDAMSASDMTAEADELEKVLLEGGVYLYM